MRSRNDWKHTSTPVAEHRLSDRMGDQFPGASREALRAFAESDLARATVPDCDAATLSNAIVVLGLDDEMYAEQRGNEAVLRRVGA